MIIAKIKTAAIDKTRLFKSDRGVTYLDLVLIESPNDKYGNDYMVVQGVSKEDRAAGVKGAILGNAKIFGPRPGAGDGGDAGKRRPPEKRDAATPPSPQDPGNLDEDVPF